MITRTKLFTVGILSLFLGSSAFSAIWSNKFTSNPNPEAIGWTNNSTAGISGNGTGLTNLITINVRDFGATGNNSTDDFNAIQSAAWKAQSIVGGEMFVPAGIYKISHPIQITNAGFRIRGEGGLGAYSSSKLGRSRDSGSVIYQTDPTQNCFSVTNNDVDRIIIISLVLQATNGSTGAAIFINNPTIANSDHCVFSQLVINGFRDAFIFTNVANTSIRDIHADVGRYFLLSRGGANFGISIQNVGCVADTFADIQSGIYSVSDCACHVTNVFKLDGTFLSSKGCYWECYGTNVFARISLTNTCSFAFDGGSINDSEGASYAIADWMNPGASPNYVSILNSPSLQCLGRALDNGVVTEIFSSSAINASIQSFCPFQYSVGVAAGATRGRYLTGVFTHNTSSDGFIPSTNQVGITRFLDNDVRSHLQIAAVTNNGSASGGAFIDLLAFDGEVKQLSTLTFGNGQAMSSVSGTGIQIPVYNSGLRNCTIIGQGLGDAANGTLIPFKWNNTQRNGALFAAGNVTSLGLMTGAYWYGGYAAESWSTKANGIVCDYAANTVTVFANQGLTGDGAFNPTSIMTFKTNGYSTSFTNFTAFTTTTAITNTLGVNAVCYLSATSATLSAPNAMTIQTFGVVITLPVFLKPGWYLTGVGLSGTIIPL